MGCEETGNWRGGGEEKDCYTISKESQELLNDITTHSILGDSEAINRSQKKRLTSALSPPLFFFSWQTVGLDAERGLSRAHCLIREQQVGSQGAREEKKTHTHHLLSYESYSATLSPDIYTHTYAPLHTCTHTQINQQLSLNINLPSTGMRWMDRCSSPIKCQE